MSLPLTLPAYFLDATATVQVTIINNYYTAQVNFYNVVMLAYQVTLTQQVPYVTLPSNLQIGSFVIKSGLLTMQPPTNTQPGTVRLDCAYTDLNVTEPQALNAVIADWTLGE